MNPPAMLASLLLLLGLFAWSAVRRYQLLRAVGGDAPLRLNSVSELLARVKMTVIYAFGQRKMPYYKAAGIAHILIFFGFLVLLLRSLLLWGRGFDPTFDFYGALAHGSGLSTVYAILKDFFAMLVIIGSSIFLYFRIVKREKRMSLGSEGLIILFIIITMMLADFLYDGAANLLRHRALGRSVTPSWSDPMGSLVATALTPLRLEVNQLTALEHLGFWWHSLFVLIFLNLLPYSKHFHIITAIPNVFAMPLKPRGQLRPVDDLEGRVEREEALGLGKIEDLSWKEVLDTYTCTECGRCSDNCPAYTTGKMLSPKHLMLALREHLYDSEARLTLATDVPHADSQDRVPEGRQELGYGAPEGGYFRSSEEVNLVPGIMDPNVIWACTTCRACEEQCPVMITFIDKIVGMRRDQVLMHAAMPAELEKPMTAMEVNGNPWNLPSSERAQWCDGLDVAFLRDKPDAEVLYWVGCAASYDDRAKRIARATASLLKLADVGFAILGSEERCTGDPARRAGNEYLFEMLAQANIETLKSYKAETKKIITACPHCFNTLAREYPQFNAHFEVVHHTTFLLELVQAGRIPLESTKAQSFVFHDSCYLGRFNDIYDAPRELLKAVPGLDLKEVPYWSKNKGLCCGAGGAQMWMEEQNQDRVNNKRALQLVDTGADAVASACPFCATMLEDGLKATGKSVTQLDVAEILAMSVATGSASSAEVQP